MLQSLVGELLLRQVPEHLLAGLKAGDLQIYGSIIRSLASGQIVGHLQETGALSPATEALLTFAADQVRDLSLADFTPVGAVAKVGSLVVDGASHTASFLQTEKIKSLVGAVQDLQLANLAISVAGIGVSIAGFAVLSAKIARVERKVDALGSKLDAIARGVEGLRRDRIGEDFTRLRTAVERMSEAWHLGDPASQWRHVAGEAHAVANAFERRAGDVMNDSDADPLTAEPFLDALALATATRVSARLAAGDDVVARRASEEGAISLSKFGDKLRPAELTLARLRAEGIEPGGTGWAEALDRTADSLRPTIAAVRQREAAAAGTTLTLAELQSQEIRGRAWLETARTEQESPLLCLLPRIA